MTEPRDDDWEDVPDAEGLPSDVRNGAIVEPGDTDPSLNDPPEPGE